MKASTGFFEGTQLAGVLLVLVHVLFNGFGHALLRMINQKLHFILSPFYLGLVGLGVSGVALALTGNDLYDISLKKFLAFGALNLDLWVGEVLLSYAFKHDKGGRVAVIRQVEVFFSFATDLLFFHESFVTLHYIGGLMVFGSVVAVTLLKGRKSEKK